MRVVLRLHGFPERERTLDLGPAATVQDALRAAGIPAGLVLAFRGDRPVPDTQPLEDGETLRVVRVVSGGATGGTGGGRTFLSSTQHCALPPWPGPLRT